MILEAKKDFRLNCIEDVAVPARPVQTETDPGQQTDEQVPEQAATGEETAPQNLFANDPAYQSEVIRPSKDRRKAKTPKEPREPKGPSKLVTWIREKSQRVTEAAEGAFNTTIGDIFDGMK